MATISDVRMETVAFRATTNGVTSHILLEKPRDPTRFLLEGVSWGLGQAGTGALASMWLGTVDVNGLSLTNSWNAVASHFSIFVGAIRTNQIGWDYPEVNLHGIPWNDELHVVKQNGSGSTIKSITTIFYRIETLSDKEWVQSLANDVPSNWKKADTNLP